MSPCFCGAYMVTPFQGRLVCVRCGRDRGEDFPQHALRGDKGFRYRWNEKRQKFLRFIPDTLEELYAEFDRCDAPQELPL